MPKRSRLPRPPAPAPSAPARRDPLTRLTRFNEILALGLVAASLFLTFANSLDRPNAPPVSLDHFPDPLQKAAIITVHTRTPWVTLALAGLVIAVIGYRQRNNPAPSRLIKFSPLIIPLVLAIHSAAQYHLQTESPLHIEIHGPAPAEFNLDLGTLPSLGTNPATAPTLHATAITRLTIAEGTRQQWSFLFASDFMYAVPILLAWVLAHAPKSPRPAANQLKTQN